MLYCSLSKKGERSTLKAEMEELLFEPCRRLVEIVLVRELPGWVEEERWRSILVSQVWKVLEMVRELRAGKRRRKVLILRYGLKDGRSRTLEEVGKEFEVTRERIRQIESRTLKPLRDPSRSRHLAIFLAPTPEEAKRELEELKEEVRETERLKEERKKEERKRETFQKLLFQFRPNLSHPNRYLNRIIMSGITYSQFRKLSKKELITRLGIGSKPTKTKQVLLELQRRMLAK